MSARDELIARAAARGRRPEAEADDELAKTIALMRVSESVTLTGPALANVLAELERAKRESAELARLRAVARNAVETGRLLGINFGPLADAVGML